MEHPVINELDRLSLTKDIIERNRIIEQYRLFGILDRTDAINKIKRLRVTDLEVATVTTAELARGSICFEQCTNDQIINELIMQRNILQAKLAQQQMEEQK